MQLPVRPVGGSGSRSGPNSPPTFPTPPRLLRKFTATIRRPLPRPVRVVLLWLAPIFLLVAGLVALISLSGGVSLRALEQHQSNADTSQAGISQVIASSPLIGQSFRTPRGGINRVTIELATRPDLSQPGEIRLLAGDGLTGTVLYTTSLASARFEDPRLTVEVPPLVGDTSYTLIFETPGRPLTGSFAVRYNTFDMLSSGNMYDDGGAEDGDLVLVLSYGYGLPNLLADILATLSGSLFEIIAWIVLLFLPGLALLSWLPSGMNQGQRVIAAPALTILTLPVLLLVTRSAGLPLGTLGIWLIVLLSGGAFGWSLYRNFAASRKPSPTSTPPANRVSTLRERLRLLPIDLLFWGLLTLIFVLTLAVRFMSLRDAPAGMGLDAYHHTLIPRMIIDSGGVPQNYLPYAQLSSFTYHYGFHALVASLAWLTGQTSSDSLLLLMPRVGQFSTALPVLTLTLFGWRAFNNRWAGLIAGAFAGLACIFPAYYVNWSRYTQGLGLALLPVAWLLTWNICQLRISDMGLRIWKKKPPASPPDQSEIQNPQSEIRNPKSAIERSGPYILAVLGIAGLFLTHYRIAMIFVVMLALYIGVRVIIGLTTRRKPANTNPAEAPEISSFTILRRAILLGVLSLAALSPWLLNLSQNFHSHLVGRDTEASRLYYNPADMLGFVQHPTMLVLYILAFIGLVLILAFRQPVWPLLLVAGAWALVGLWSNPYLFSAILPNSRLPYSGYLDVNTWIQSIWLPLALLAGYGLEGISRWVLQAGNSLSGAPARLWRTGLRASAGAALALLALAISLPIAADIDGKPYVAPADREALIWMRDNLPPNSTILSNPFAFKWAQTNVYGSDAGSWIPLVSGVSTTVPPLPAYNEALADPEYLNNILGIIQFEPFDSTMSEKDWETLKERGITHIYSGSRGGAINVSLLLKDNHTELVFHKDGVYVFALR